MARGNQRDKAREKNQKDAASVVSYPQDHSCMDQVLTRPQKKKNNVWLLNPLQ